MNSIPDDEARICEVIAHLKDEHDAAAAHAPAIATHSPRLSRRTCICTSTDTVMFPEAQERHGAAVAE